MFVDEIEIFVIGGKGGDGCAAMRREKYIPKGGPAGGDGGHGGSVYLQADDSYNTLHHLAGHHHWRGEKGRPGLGKKRHGRRGKDIIVPVPAGTIIYDVENGILLRDMTEPDEKVCVAEGGQGGRGNTHFTTPTHQAPREFEQGTPGRERKLRLELKLIADTGLLGLPNAGKSTLISRISAARPKIASYPFTTLHPCLGIVEMSNFRRFVMADIPGIIEGAHDGAGLGDEFLRHIERTRILVHMVDIMPLDGDPLKNYKTIRHELEEYSPKLAEKPEVLVLNKTDLTGSEDAVRKFEESVGKKAFAISAVTGKGLEALTEHIWNLVQEQPDT